MLNQQRNFIKIITGICKEEGIAIEPLASEWIFRLTKDGETTYIVGYQFGLNHATASAICNDKSVTSEILTKAHIPNVGHHFFMDIQNRAYIGDVGIWQELLELLKEFGKLVCKPNEGTGGENVYLVTNPYELEVAVNTIFQKSRTMAVSPFYDIEDEYRCVILDGEIRLIFKKERGYVVGNGIDSVGKLIASQKDNVANIEDKDISSVPQEGVRYYLSWKHNLGLGASSKTVDISEVDTEVARLAKASASEVNVRFASVDIVRTASGYRVLEVNSGVMLENFSKQSDTNYRIAKEIYREAILKTYR